MDLFPTIIWGFQNNDRTSSASVISSVGLMTEFVPFGCLPDSRFDDLFASMAADFIFNYASRDRIYIGIIRSISTIYLPSAMRATGVWVHEKGGVTHLFDFVLLRSSRTFGWEVLMLESGRHSVTPFSRKGLATAFADANAERLRVALQVNIGS